MLPDLGNAEKHPQFEEAVARAVVRAFRNKDETFVVLYDGKDIIMQISSAARPVTFRLVCSAKHFQERAVLVRYTKGNRETYIKV